MNVCIYGNGELIKLIDKPNDYIRDQKTIDLISQKRLTDMLYMKYMSNLDDKARRVLIFIMARTLGYNKLKEIIKISHFTDGVMYEDRLIQHPTGLSERSVQRALDDLVTKNYVMVEQRKYNGCDQAYIYYINIDFFNKEIKKNVKELAVAKKDKENALKKIKKNESLMAQLPPNFLGDSTQNSEQNLGESLEEITNLKSSNPVKYGVTGQTPQGVASDTPITTKERYNHFLKKERDKQPDGCFGFSLKEILDLYEKNYKKYYKSQYIPICKSKKREKEKLKTLQTKLKETENINFADLFEFIFKEWSFICHQKLYFLEDHNKRSLPSAPDLGLIVSFIDKILDAYRQERPEIEAIYGDPVGYRAKQLQKLGYSSEFAMKRALMEQDIGQGKKVPSNDHTEAFQLKLEIELAKIRAEHEKEMMYLRNENEKLKAENLKNNSFGILKYDIDDL